MSEVELHTASLESFIPQTALQVWALDAAEAYKVATSLVKTSFVPQSLRGKPEEAAAAILTGNEIGLSPMAALRSIDIIQGTPAMRAHALRGLVQSRGHEVWVEDASATRAVVSGKRKGSQQVQTTTWDLDRARGLGLLTKDNWKKQPQAMLVARATSELCRLIASDVLLGLPYSIEELADAEAEPTAAPKKVSRSTRPQAPAPVEPDLAPESTEATAPADIEPAAEPDLSWPEVAPVGGEG